MATKKNTKDYRAYNLRDSFGKAGHISILIKDGAFVGQIATKVTLDYVLTDIEFREWLDDFYAAYIGIMPKNYFQYLNHSRVNTVLVDEDTLLLFINNDNEEGRY